MQLITGAESEILCKSCLEIGGVWGSRLRGSEGHNWGGTILGSNSKKESLQITAPAEDGDTQSVSQPLAEFWSHSEEELSPSCTSLKTGAG